MVDIDFWSEQCPRRGAGLSHVHWDKCNPASTHPNRAGEDNAGRKHASDQCCHCELTRAEAQAIADRLEAISKQPAPPIHLADHRYRFSVGGCAEKGCGRPENAHPAFLSQVEDGECPVDHRSITIRVLVGDEGREWTRCPICEVMLEPALARGWPDGPSYGPGRFPFVQRRVDMLTRIRKAWKGGFYKS